MPPTTWLVWGHAKAFQNDEAESSKDEQEYKSEASPLQKIKAPAEQKPYPEPLNEGILISQPNCHSPSHLSASTARLPPHTLGHP
jgi:hypothetical protein